MGKLWIAVTKDTVRSYSPETPQPHSERKGLPSLPALRNKRGAESASEPGAEPDERVITNVFQTVSKKLSSKAISLLAQCFHTQAASCISSIGKVKYC